MINKLNEIIDKYNELADQLSKPEIISDLNLYKKISQEYSGLKDKALIAQNYIAKINEIQDLKSIVEKEEDEELKELASEELLELNNEVKKLEESIKHLLIESDPDDQKNIIMEIRSGTGGIEAALFADDLFRMYLRYAENEGWKPELMNLNQNDGGGIKEAIFSFFNISSICISSPHTEFFNFETCVRFSIFRLLSVFAAILSTSKSILIFNYMTNKNQSRIEIG